MTFERTVHGISIYRDPDNLKPHEILYCQQNEVVYVGARVDVEILAFDIAITEDDREMLTSLRVGI